MKWFLRITGIFFLLGNRKANIIYWSVLTVLMVMALSGCKKNLEPDFPVNNTIKAELIGKGIPADIAQFFAGARMETKSPNDTTCIYLQTYPNGATREITLRVSPNRHYTPTPGEIANITPGGAPIYDFKYASSVQSDGTTKIDLNYYVAAEGLPVGEANHTLSSALETDQPRSKALLEIAGGKGGTEGAGISWEEIGNKGSDVAIGSLIDYAKETGINVGLLGSIYALASALSDVVGALDLSKQNTGWMLELADLENCAANPTNQVAKSDPNYSPAAVAKIQAARSELEQVTAVRFLNIMTETGSGINPVTAILSVGLKQGFVWSEQTLGNYSESTIMREARLAVVPCDNSALDGNIDVLWDCTSTIADQVDHEMWHIVTKVNWVYNPSDKQYYSQGNFTYEYTSTSTANGITCTDKKFAAGSIANTGVLLVINDPALQNMMGYGYSAAGQIDIDATVTSSCPGTSGLENVRINWLPPIKAYQGTGGSYEGEMTNPSCIGGSATGTEKVTWSFSVPSAK
jgi:hypothetical protein